MTRSKTTEELKKELMSCNDIRAFLAENQEFFLKTSFVEYLEQLIQEKGLKKSEIVKDSGLDQTYAYQIISGKKNPSRDKLLCLTLALGLNDKETENLLYLAGKPALYPKKPRDVIILYALNHKLSVIKTDELLYEANEKTLLESQ